MASEVTPQPAVRSTTRATLPITLLVQIAASAAVLAPSVAAPRLLTHLGLTPVAVGVYIALVYAAAALSSQWAAALIKRWGPIRTSQVSVLLCGCGVLLVSLPHLGPAVLGALLIGAGYGPITPASSEILARTTPPHRYALVFSLKQTGVPGGGALAGLLVPTVLNLAGHVAALGQIALLCVAGAALGEALRGDLDRLRNPRSPLPTLALMSQPIRFVLADPMLRRLALCSLVFSTVQVCLTAYLVSFLHADLMWTLVAAGAAVSTAQLAGVFGRVAWGVVADVRRDARGTLLGLAGAMTLASLAMSLLTPGTPTLWVITLLIAYGATGVGWNGVFLATVARVVPMQQAAAATAGSLFFTYVGVVVGPPLFGAIGERVGTLGIAYSLLALPLACTIWLLARAHWETAPAQQR